MFSTTNVRLCRSFKVKGFPTLHLIQHDGFTIEHDRKRDMHSLIHFIRLGYEKGNKVPILAMESKL